MFWQEGAYIHALCNQSHQLSYAFIRVDGYKGVSHLRTPAINTTNEGSDDSASVPIHRHASRHSCTVITANEKLNLVTRH